MEASYPLCLFFFFFFVEYTVVIWYLDVVFGAKNTNQYLQRYEHATHDWESIAFDKVVIAKF
jgi:hypothetical protein